MCGIFAILNNNENVYSNKTIETFFERGRNRGPENSKLLNVGKDLILGFHRLAINGLDEVSNQPITIGDVTLICNGEIYNYTELYMMMNVLPETNSDCEVIIHLYKKYGISQTLQMLDGVFAFILLDYDVTQDNAKMFVARDPYGVRPLYRRHDVHNFTKNIFTFASELKMFPEMTGPNSFTSSVVHFQPGTYSVYQYPFTVNGQWIHDSNNVYHKTTFPLCVYGNDYYHYRYDGTTRYIDNIVTPNIQHYLKEAVYKRCAITDRPVACLLSGGLDSSLVTALTCEYLKSVGKHSRDLETYSIGMEGSVDLCYARKVADYLGTTHTEILLTEQDFIDAIPEVIYSIESYDTTTVRASIGNYLLGKYISQHSDAKVILNGDGSDELCGGYLYMRACPDAIEFDKETRRLLQDIHAFDVLRSDKCISSHGLEPRTPFLDRSWVQYYLSIPANIRYMMCMEECEKYLLRYAFSFSKFKNIEGKKLLPKEVLWRRKEAFSDGVGKQTRSLYEIIGEKYDEKKYYKQEFISHFGEDSLDVVPYLWMPKYVEATDASARTLELYKNEK